MGKSLRYIWQLLILTSLLVLAGMVALHHTTLSFPAEVYLITVGSVTVINLLSFLILGAGIRKKDQGGIALMLAGVGLKFMLYLLFILVFWLVTKNLDIDFIVTFFALYLIFTFFLAIHLFKLLKNK